jgi:hypothetical protein
MLTASERISKLSSSSIGVTFTAVRIDTVAA